MLADEVTRLDYMLKKEKEKTSEAESKEIQLSKDLEEIKQQLEKEKSLKELHTNQAKEEKERELAKIQAQKLSTDIQVEKDRNKCLQEKLDTVKISYDNLNLKYETEVGLVKRQAETLQQELNREKSSNVDKIFQDHLLINKLRDEQNNLRQQMAQERTLLQQSSRKIEKDLQTELDKINTSYQELSSKYESDVLTARNEVERLQLEVKREMMSHTKTVMENLRLMNTIRAEMVAEQEKMSREIDLEKQTSAQRDLYFQAELKDLKNQIKHDSD